MSANFFDKQPSEIFHIKVKFGTRLDTGETIVSKTVSAVNIATNADATSAIIRDSAIDVSDIDTSVKGGTTGDDYKITVKITTSGDNILEEEVIMHVVEE